jgi:hypothetical protein
MFAVNGGIYGQVYSFASLPSDKRAVAQTYTQWAIAACHCVSFVVTHTGMHLLLRLHLESEGACLGIENKVPLLLLKN